MGLIEILEDGKVNDWQSGQKKSYSSQKDFVIMKILYFCYFHSKVCESDIFAEKVELYKSIFRNSIVYTSWKDIKLNMKQ